MARKKKPSIRRGRSVPAKRQKASKAPKWQRDGFSSYRQYLNARYRALGFRSYSDYSHKRALGIVPSTRRVPHAGPGTAVPEYKLTDKPLPDVAGMTRISYESINPISYTIGQSVGPQIVAWINRVIAEIKVIHGDKIYSAAWRIIGKAAQALDENGKPIWNQGEWEEWSSHQDFDKAMNELLSTARAYGDHDFLQYGRQIGRGTSNIYALIIK